MYGVLYSVLKSAKDGKSEETNGRHIISVEALHACRNRSRPVLLDVGAGWGADLISISKSLVARGETPEIFAVESYEPSRQYLKAAGIAATAVDIEKEPLPYPSKHFDVVICNQVLEHTKEIFWVVSELERVLKVGGTLILGVPNLASLHNRVSLLLGRQPPAIHVFGPHVRGFAPHDLKKFFELGGALKVRKILGASFYPFPKGLARQLSKAFPRFSVSSFYVIEKVKGDGSFLDIFQTDAAALLVDTPYFRGKR